MDPWREPQGPLGRDGDDRVGESQERLRLATTELSRARIGLMAAEARRADAEVKWEEWCRERSPRRNRWHTARCMTTYWEQEVERLFAQLEEARSRR